jgi:hypothetical protein
MFWKKIGQPLTKKGEVFAIYPDQVIVIRLTAARKGSKR